MWNFIGAGLTSKNVKDIAYKVTSYRVLTVRPYNEYFYIVDGLYIVDKEIGVDLVEGYIYSLYIDKEVEPEYYGHQLIIGFREEE